MRELAEYVAFSAASAIVGFAAAALLLVADDKPVGVKMMQTAISDAKCSIRERCTTLDCRYDWR
jgi:hypothetical protein